MQKDDLKNVFRIVGLTQMIVVLMLVLTPLFITGALSLDFGKKKTEITAKKIEATQGKAVAKVSNDAAFFKASHHLSDLGSNMLDKSNKKWL